MKIDENHFQYLGLLSGEYGGLAAMPLMYKEYMRSSPTYPILDQVLDQVQCAIIVLFCALAVLLIY